MSSYRWNIKEIEEKIKYIKTRLSNSLDFTEKRKLLFTLLTYNEMLEMSGSIRYTGLYNALDKITKQRFTLKKTIKKIELFKNDLTIANDLMTAEYLQFLLQLAENVSQIKINRITKFEQTNLSKEQVVAVVKNYYSSLMDEDLSKKAANILNSDKQLLNFSKMVRNGTEEIYGKNYNDPIFKDTYCSVRYTGTIQDCANLSHEVMHGIENKYKNWLRIDEYFGLGEIATYTNDFLMNDYLNITGFDKLQIEEMKIENIETLKVLGFKTIFSLKMRLKKMKNKLYSESTIEDILELVTSDDLIDLLEVQSYIIAFGLYEQIKTSKDHGIKNLKILMATKLEKNVIPDFSNIGLSQKKLIELSTRITNIFDNEIIKEDNIESKSK